MARLFGGRELRDHLATSFGVGQAHLRSISEDDLYERSADDLVREAIEVATCENLTLETSEWVDGDFEVIESGSFETPAGRVTRYVSYVWAEFTWAGNGDLFAHQPSQFQMSELKGSVTPGRLRVDHIFDRPSVSAQEAKFAIDRVIGLIANNVVFANNDVDRYNASLESRLRPIVEQLKMQVDNQRKVRKELGLSVRRRTDAPHPVPIQRKVLGVTRVTTMAPRAERTAEQERALNDADYEDVISVLVGMLKAFERTPSVAAGRPEEFLRDILLVTLNGTFEGAATGETFVGKGKTDILVRVEDRHVFVGECKWWEGPKGASDAVDQLLGYLPWRDEKAALIFFIDRKNASAVIVAAHDAVLGHASYQRPGAESADPSIRRNYVLGQPDDPDREIHLAALFAVIRQSDPD